MDLCSGTLFFYFSSSYCLSAVCIRSTVGYYVVAEAGCNWYHRDINIYSLSNKKKISWSFLQQAMRMKGFVPKWCQWINDYIKKGSVGIRVNDDIGHHFQTQKGLRQGDSLSPILFNVVADMLAILSNKAKEDGQVAGLIPHLVEGGVSIYPPICR